MNTRVLVIDDDRRMCELIEERLTASGTHVDFRLSASEGRRLASEVEFDAVITDMNLEDASGLELCQELTAARPDTPVIVITGFGNMSVAVEAIRVGAHDFITKPFDLAALAYTVERAVQHRQLAEAVKRLKSDAGAPAQGLGELMGNSRAMHRLYDLIRRVAGAETTVLLSGESGTGKEVVARTLHAESPRRAMPFVGVNCAAVPAHLIESELFGHVRGAFTDASNTRKGLFEQAHGGTLLLDEIGELPIEMQPKLLRVLQERRVRAVGSNVDVPVDVRIIAASNRDLESQVEDGHFREDLYYRLNVVQLHVPPLRGRGNDVLLLASYFVKRFAARTRKQVTGISTRTARKLLEYDWPGNVRQLENCMERAVALTCFEQIAPEDLPEQIQRLEQARVASDNVDTERLALHQLEERYIQRVLKLTRGNKTQAAKILGLDRRTLYRKLEAYASKAGVEHELSAPADSAQARLPAASVGG